MACGKIHGALKSRTGEGYTSTLELSSLISGFVFLLPVILGRLLAHCVYFINSTYFYITLLSASNNYGEEVKLGVWNSKLVIRFGLSTQHSCQLPLDLPVREGFLVCLEIPRQETTTNSLRFLKFLMFLLGHFLVQKLAEFMSREQLTDPCQ